LRLGDCATLRWDEVDFAQGFIIRIPNKTAASDKAVRIPIFKTLAAMLADARPKTRQAYVLPEAARLYQGGADAITGRIQRLFWNAGIDCHAPGTGSQIKRDADGNPETIEGGNVALTQTGNRAVVRCGFHSLRHTFVSLCREAGAPLSVVEAIVGHSNPAMTRHYSHTSDAEATRAVAALPDITNGTPAALPAREPVPAWIREALATMTGNNWREVRAAILEGGAI
jgi:integrase